MPERWRFRNPWAYYQIGLVRSVEVFSCTTILKRTLMSLFARWNFSVLLVLINIVSLTHVLYIQITRRKIVVFVRRHVYFYLLSRWHFARFARMPNFLIAFSIGSSGVYGDGYRHQGLYPHCRCLWAVQPRRPLAVYPWRLQLAVL